MNAMQWVFQCWICVLVCKSMWLECNFLWNATKAAITIAKSMNEPFNEFLWIGTLHVAAILLSIQNINCTSFLLNFESPMWHRNSLQPISFDIQISLRLIASVMVVTNLIKTRIIKFRYEWIVFIWNLVYHDVVKKCHKNQNSPTFHQCNWIAMQSANHVTI